MTIDYDYEDDYNKAEERYTRMSERLHENNEEAQEHDNWKYNKNAK